MSLLVAFAIRSFGRALQAVLNLLKTFTARRDHDLELESALNDLF
jgi:hypothetical protein